MLEELSEEKKANLIIEFKKLNTINLKTEFWLNKFQKPYFQNYLIDYEMIKEFLIYPQSEEEQEELNIICLSEMSKYGLGKFNVLNLNTEIENFDRKLVDAKNKKHIIETEIKRIISVVEIRESENTESNNFWLHGYKESYINYGNSHLSKSNPSPKLLADLNNGFIIGEFQKHMENCLQDLKNYRDAYLSYKTTVKQQILILETTGLLEHFKRLFREKSEKKELINRDLIKFLSVLLNVGEQSLKEALNILEKKPHLYNIKTENNYQYLIDLYETVKLNDVLEVVKTKQVELKLKKSTP